MAFLISVFGCTILIMKIWEKWQTSPVIVSFAEKSTPVWQIPFPAGKLIVIKQFKFHEILPQLQFALKQKL